LRCRGEGERFLNATKAFKPEEGHAAGHGHPSHGSGLFDRAVGEADGRQDHGDGERWTGDPQRSSPYGRAAVGDQMSGGGWFSPQIFSASGGR